MPTCPTCHEEIPEGAPRCPYDGTALAVEIGDTMAAASAPKGKASDSDFAYEPTAAGDPVRSTGGPGLRSTGGPGLRSTGGAGVSRALEALFSEAKGIEPGTMIGEYEVTGLLGEGGMGQVFAAVHPIIGKKVAVKVLSEQVASNREVVLRFVAEARAVNQIGHPAIVDVFAFGQHEDGRHYYVMEHLAGRSLEEELEARGRIPAAELCQLLADPLDALEAAHQAGIIHRDLKPDNIYICDGRRRTAKLLDFGIAKLTGDDAGLARTRTGMAMGTPQFMSPEQCRGANVDHRTDIYALGIILFRALTGEFPFNGATPIELFYEHTSEPPPPPSSVAPIPEAFEKIILRCLEKEPEGRFASAADLAKALQDAAKTPGAVIETEAPPRPAPAAQGEGAKAASAPAPAPAAENTAATTAASRALLYRKIAIAIGAVTVLWLAGGIWYTLRDQGDETAALVPDAATVSAASVPDAAPAKAAAPIDAAPAVGTLAIRVNVSRADVFVDGKRVDRKRRRLFLAEKLAAGDHEVRVERRGYQPQNRTVTVMAGEQTPIEVALRRVRRNEPDTRANATKSVDKKEPEVIEDKNATIGLDELTNP